MLKQLLQAYRTHGIISETEKLIREMLKHAGHIFSASSFALIENKDVEFDVHERDQEINKLVVDIRKKIVEHLAITASENVSGELVFLKVINDIERVGDYSKNLMDLSKRLPHPLTESRYYEKFKEILPAVEGYFPKVERALFDGSEDDAKAVFESHKIVTKTCGDILEELMKDETLKGPEAIVLALTARYFKRVSSHLKNVASTAVNPYSHIGYTKGKEEAQEPD